MNTEQVINFRLIENATTIRIATIDTATSCGSPFGTKIVDLLLAAVILALRRRALYSKREASSAYSAVLAAIAAANVRKTIELELAAVEVTRDPKLERRVQPGAGERACAT